MKFLDAISECYFAPVRGKAPRITHQESHLRYASRWLLYLDHCLRRSIITRLLPTAATTIFFNTAAWKEFYRVASLRKRKLFYAGNSRCLSTPRRLAVSKNGSGTIHAICYAELPDEGEKIYRCVLLHRGEYTIAATPANQQKGKKRKDIF